MKNSNFLKLIKNIVENIVENVEYWVFPPKCPYCKRLIVYGEPECYQCRREFPQYPVISHIKGKNIILISPFSYEDVVKDAVARYKYLRYKYSAKSFADMIIFAISKAYSENPEIFGKNYKGKFDFVTFVPLSNEKKMERGYDQSELLAYEVSKRLDIPCEKILIKNSNTREQHLFREESIISEEYSALNIQKVKGKAILLIDDIITSGNTMNKCSTVLENAGADFVVCAAAAMAGYLSFGD